MDISLQYDVQALFARYAELLDDGPLEEWPNLFMEDSLYLVIPRENYDENLPLAIMRCESKGMLQDRVQSVQSTIMHEPRYLRHQITNIQVAEPAPSDDTLIQVTANYSVIEVLQNELPRILSVGRYLSAIHRAPESELKFQALRVIFDSVMVPNTIVYPL